MAVCILCNAAYSPICVCILLKQLSYRLEKHNNWVHIQLDLMKKLLFHKVAGHIIHTEKYDF